MLKGDQMNKEQLQAIGLSEEQINAVLDGFKGYVPPSRFNEVNEAKKQAEALLKERDTQLETFKVSLSNQDELSKQIESLQKENQRSKDKYERDLLAMKRDNAVDMELTRCGARNIKAVKALLDLNNISLQDDKLIGLSDQLKALQSDEATSFMFKTESKATPVGMKAAENTPQLSKPIHEMNYSERVAFLESGGQL